MQQPVKMNTMITTAFLFTQRGPLQDAGTSAAPGRLHEVLPSRDGIHLINSKRLVVILGE
jgi:hypothetical protein